MNPNSSSGAGWWNGNNGSLLGGGIGSLFGKNPYNAASGYLNQIPGVLQSSLGQYTQQGSQLSPQLQAYYSSLEQNPAGLQNQIGSTYQSSPGYQFQVNQATDSANRSAAAGGLAGSAGVQSQVGSIADQLANQNYWQYVNTGLNTYKTGLGGLQGLENQDFGATEDYANAYANTLAEQGGLAEAGQGYRNNQLAGGGSLIGQFLGNLF